MMPKRNGGLTLLEVTFATAIAVSVCVAIMGGMLSANMAKRQLHDQTVCYRASHQMLEILLGQDIDTMIAQNGLTFTVVGTRKANETGSVAIADLNWGGANNAYQVSISVPDYGVVLRTVRVRT